MCFFTAFGIGYCRLLLLVHEFPLRACLKICIYSLCPTAVQCPCSDACHFGHFVHLLALHCVMVRPLLSQITTQGMSYHTVDVVSVLISIFFFFSSFFSVFCFMRSRKEALGTSGAAFFKLDFLSFHPAVSVKALKGACGRLWLYNIVVYMPSVLWRCWLGGRKGIQPVKKLEWWGAVVIICLERGADLHMAQLMPLPLTVLLQ